MLNYNHSIGSLVDMHTIKKMLGDVLVEWSNGISSKEVYNREDI